MISDRDRRILAETERQIRLEDPDLARWIESTRKTGTRPHVRARLAALATSMTVMIVLLLFLVVSVVLGMPAAIYVFLALATTSIWGRLRRERDR